MAQERHRRGVTADLDARNHQRLIVDSEIDLAPDPLLVTALPFALPLDLDPSSVDQEVQRALGAAIRDENCPRPSVGGTAC